ncbi:Amidase [Penicillium maclennaniae]|uniref:Amidase n=1 Tax=Penicillium maclennaniae TaxID=1343394 RepID=UPI0025411BA6|nr:Amidase [Penicillium maclennaniae]KAJ5677486.1 Amidase [Penicillium maclennaniae]
MGSTEQPWEPIVAQKRAARDKLLAPYLVEDVDHRQPRVDQVHERSRSKDPEAQRITEIDGIEELSQCVLKRQFTAEQVIRAYIQRAVVAHQLTNCLSEVVFEDALEQARKLDALFEVTNKPKGPLHGIPVTVKDQFNIRGIDTTLGYVGRSFAPAQEDAVLVQILKNLGAIIIAKTNLPQSILWAETDNPLWGLTTNARNPDFSAGGSTGGEGALLALHASLLGFGTDIGGSIRIPQSTMGLYGFKPSSGRYPYQGVPVSTEGQEHVPSSVGPMARDLNSLRYNETAFQEIQARSMVIGLIMDDGVVQVHPPIARALRELSDVLKAQGHEIVIWDTSDHAACIEIMNLYYTADRGEDIRRDVATAGEPYIPHVEALVNRGKPISVYEYWQLNKRKMAAQKKYLDKWNAVRSPSEKPVDILLSPTLPHTAVPHGKFRWVGYTKIWNFLDYPALTFPVDEVRAEQDSLPAEPYIPRNPLDEWNWNLYDAEKVDGYPVNLQIIGRKLQEEKVLGAATLVEKIWRSRVKNT